MGSHLQTVIKMTLPEDDEARGWSLFPPSQDEIDSIKKQEKFLLLSDSGSAQTLTTPINWAGIVFALILILFFIQLASPGLRQIQDFVSAIYSPYATDELLNRYDTYYDDYESRPSKQFNNQYRSFDEAQGLLSQLLILDQEKCSSSLGTIRTQDDEPGPALDQLNNQNSLVDHLPRLSKLMNNFCVVLFVISKGCQMP